MHSKHDLDLRHGGDHEETYLRQRSWVHPADDRDFQHGGDVGRTGDAPRSHRVRVNEKPPATNGGSTKSKFLSHRDHYGFNASRTMVFTACVRVR